MCMVSAYSLCPLAPVVKQLIARGALAGVLPQNWGGGGGGIWGGGGGGWHKASVSDCLPLAAPIGLSPLLILTLCGPERVLVVEGGGVQRAAKRDELCTPLSRWCREHGALVWWSPLGMPSLAMAIDGPEVGRLGWAGSRLAPKAVSHGLHDLTSPARPGPDLRFIWSHSRPDCSRTPNLARVLAGGRVGMSFLRGLEGRGRENLRIKTDY